MGSKNNGGLLGQSSEVKQMNLIKRNKTEWLINNYFYKT